MLEDMRADYDHTQAAFGVIVTAALAEIRCRDELKAQIREAAKYVYRADWQAVRHYNLDRLFLAWLCGEMQGWLYQHRAFDHHLPATVLDGLEHADAKEQHARERARRERIERCSLLLRSGWPEDEAVAFVCSREEWQAARAAVGRVAA